MLVCLNTYLFLVKLRSGGKNILNKLKMGVFFKVNCERGVIQSGKDRGKKECMATGNLKGKLQG